MSVINSANPGSHIPSLIFVDKLLNRRIIKNADYYSIDLILEENAPDNLFVKDKLNDEGEFDLHDNPKKKLPEAIAFWSKIGLWETSDDGIKATSVLSNDSNLAARIVRTIFGRKYEILTGNDIEPMIRAMCTFLALDKHSFGGEYLNSAELALSNDKYMPLQSHEQTRLTINSSDASNFLEYGLLLGYMEKIGNDRYIVDPTRLIKSYLVDLFEPENTQKSPSISIKVFIEKLNKKIPIFDGGEYRVKVEELMQTKKNDWEPSPDYVISKSLSHALYRLKLEGEIFLDKRSDSLDSVTIQLANNETEEVSHIELVRGIK